MSLYESSGELYAFDEISLRKIFVLVSACIPLVAFDGMSTVAPARYLRNVMSQTLQVSWRLSCCITGWRLGLTEAGTDHRQSAQMRFRAPCEFGCWWAVNSLSSDQC
jgi:hypothetical protein